MSTRFYPIYQKGGPQLRVFLPNFWMKLVRPAHEQPPNVVQFACSMEMTRYDMKNYLEKIYNIKPAHIRTRIASGKTKKERVNGYVIKEDDTKYAYVTLQKDEHFEFPNLFPRDQTDLEDYEKSLEMAKQSLEDFKARNKDRLEVPGWFSI